MLGCPRLSRTTSNSTLKIVNGELRKEEIDDKGSMCSLLVVPESITKTIIQSLHISFSHANCWRLESFISKIYYIPRLKPTLREVYKSCEPCLLSQAPVAAKARRGITVTGTTAAKEVNVDLLSLPPSKGYNYALVAVCVASGMVFAKPLKSKNSQECAVAMLDICYSNSFLCRIIT